VRHSYRPGLFLVHGGVGRREDRRLAAARELQEEVGVTIDRHALRLVAVASTELGLNYLYETRVMEKPN
jgi:8-oxo-dGTP pyrophosphatase MutT (NUDIX family)